MGLVTGPKNERNMSCLVKHDSSSVGWGSNKTGNSSRNDLFKNSVNYKLIQNLCLNPLEKVRSKKDQRGLLVVRPGFIIVPLGIIFYAFIIS